MSLQMSTSLNTHDILHVLYTEALGLLTIIEQIATGLLCQEIKHHVPCVFKLGN